MHYYLFHRLIATCLLITLILRIRIYSSTHFLSRRETFSFSDTFRPGSRLVQLRGDGLQKGIREVNRYCKELLGSRLRTRRLQFEGARDAAGLPEQSQSALILPLCMR